MGKLEEFNKDFFLVFAHVEKASGLWEELDGGRLQQLGLDESFKRHVLGFQKVRTYDKSGKDKKCRTKVKDWLGDVYPAEVEGSDPSSKDGIGAGKVCHLKIGALTYEAVKFALIDHKNRLCQGNAHQYTHSHIRQIRFEGGLLKDHAICDSIYI